MDIHSDSYKVAALSEQEEALEIIRNAEASIAHLTEPYRYLNRL